MLAEKHLYNKDILEIINDSFNLLQSRLNQASFNNRASQNNLITAFIKKDNLLFNKSLDDLLKQRSELINNLIDDQKNFLDYLKLIEKEL